MSCYWSALARASGDDVRHADLHAAPRDPLPFEADQPDDLTGFDEVAEIDAAPHAPSELERKATVAAIPKADEPATGATNATPPASVPHATPRPEKADPPTSPKAQASDSDGPPRALPFPPPPAPEPWPTRMSERAEEPVPHGNIAMPPVLPAPEPARPAPAEMAVVPAAAQPALAPPVPEPVAPTPVVAVPAVVVAALAEQVATHTSVVPEPSPAPIVIAIDQLEIRLGEAPAAAPPSRRERPAPIVSLDQYLRRPGDAA